MRTLRIGLIISLCLLFTRPVWAVDNSYKLDFDGDGGTDIALYREGSRNPLLAPQTSYWYFLNPRTGQMYAMPWGRTLDVPTAADYDNDGITDVGIHRWWNFETGDVNEWWFSKSATNGHLVLAYEVFSYVQYNRNYVGDGRADIGQMYQINISQDPSETCYISIFFIGDLDGTAIRKTVGDACNVNPAPAPGDYNNDGRSDIAVFNNQTFRVWFPPYNSGATAPDATQFLDVDFPAPGDYDGDGKTDFAGTKSVAGRMLWRIKRSATGEETETSFGFATDKPTPGDYDGDGKTDLAVFRPSEGSWWILYSGSGILGLFHYGLPTDVPLAAPIMTFDPSS